jgi:glycine/D-amino acid oxidase-like deaminating enzyme
MPPQMQTRRELKRPGANPAHMKSSPAGLRRVPWSDDVDVRVQEALALPGGGGTATGVAPGTRVDIAVVGAGVAGLNAALGASSLGARVVVLEAASHIGMGATGRNAGILSAGINMGLADLPEGSPDRDMWPATTTELLALAAEARRPDTLLLASLTGALSLAETPTAARHLAREAVARVRMGLRAEVWSPGQVAEATAGHLETSRVVQALWLPDEGRIQPLTLLAHLAQKARRAGIELMGNTQVTGYEEQTSSTGWQLHIAGGATVTAAGVLIATGPTTLPTGRLYALAFPADLPDSFPLFWDSAPYTYCDFRPGQGRLTVSGGRYGRPGASGRDHVYHRRLAEAARRWLPELATVPPAYAWAVDIAVTSTMRPQARRLDGHAPGYAIEGLGALGVLPGSVLGRRSGEDLARELS